MKTRLVTMAEIEYTAFSLAEKFMTWDEPIPEFGSRFPNVLESCISQPNVAFGGKDMYRGLVGKGSILFYLLIKNHPFRNGNKRIAVMTLLYFLYKNGRWLDIDQVNLYRFARGIAETKSKKMQDLIFDIQDFLNKHIVLFKE
jgi:death-on-curing protein